MISITYKEDRTSDMNDVYIEEDKSILDAIQRLDKSGKKILFVHRDRKLLASLTDGDIRRWILKN